MSNRSNHDSLTGITSLEPARRESLQQEKGATGDSQKSGEMLVPQRRPIGLHPYASPQAVATNASGAMQPPTNGWWADLALRETPGWAMTVWVAILGLIAFGLAGYMTLSWFTETKVVGCNGSVFNCDNVLNSRWSNWLGLPVSGLATLTYGCLLGALILAQSGSNAKRNFLWLIVMVCSLSAGAAALWFIGLQIFVLKHFCLYCLGAHACGIALALTMLILRPFGNRLTFQMGLLAMFGLTFLSAGQAIGEKPPTYEIKEHIVETPVVSEEKENVAPAGFEQEEVVPPALDDIFEAPDFGQLGPQRRSFHTSTFLVANLFLPTGAHAALNNLSHSAVICLQDGAPPMSEKETGKEPRQGEMEPTTEQEKEIKQDSNQADAAQQPAPTETPPPQPPQTRRVLEVAGGVVKLDVKQWPMAGKTDADFVCVEMFDYNCQHCRQTHAAVNAAKEKLGDKFAVIALPLPLNTSCNNQIVQTNPQFMESCLQAKLAVAVWKTNPEKFGEFHDWMFSGPTAPTYAAAKTHADSLVGKEELEKVLNSKLPDAYIQKHVQIYGLLNKGSIPKLLFRTTSIVGLFESPDMLIDILNRQGPLVDSPVPN